MIRRANATERTREAILSATSDLFWADPAADLTLSRIAGAAGVSVQTVIRHFGGRDGTFDAALDREVARVLDERDPARATTPAGAVHLLVAHYERLGDKVMRLLAEEHRSPPVGRVVAQARLVHRAWCEQVFGRELAGLAPQARRRRLAQLVAVCDVYTWKLLRRDAGLDRRSTEQAMVEMLIPLLEAP